MIVRQFLHWLRTAPSGTRAEATGALDSDEQVIELVGVQRLAELVEGGGERGAVIIYFGGGNQNLAEEVGDVVGQKEAEEICNLQSGAQ